MGEKNIIELNGKTYDTLTGKPVHPSKSTTYTTPQLKPTIDGFIGKRARPLRQVNSKAAHKPERTKTLMRNSVKKPRSSSKSIYQLQAMAGSSRAQPVKDNPIASRTAINERHLIHSRQIHKSHLISRFRSHEKLSNTTFTKFVKPEKKPDKPSAQTPVDHKSISSYSSGRTKDNILAIGLAKATSHQEKFSPQPKHSNKTKAQRRHTLRKVSISIVSLIVLVIIGWILYQNLPSIELRIVSMRSGVHAEMPGYRPAGFRSIVPIQYSSNSVIITFRSKTNKDFTITQQNSNWDSQTLRDSFVSLSGSSYQTFQNKGRTIYIFGIDQATWVNAGIWYQISGNTNLTTTQLMDIANSM